MAPETAGSESWVVASGVTLDSGSPLPRMHVLAFAEPTPEALEASGARGLRWLPLGRATTGITGRFTVTANMGGVPSEYVGAHGETDVVLVVADENREISWSYTLFPPGREVPGAVSAVASAADLPESGELANGALSPAVRFDVGTRTAWNVGNGPARWLDQQGEPYLAGSSTDPNAVSVQATAGGKPALTVPGSMLVAVDRPTGIVKYGLDYLTSSAETRRAMLDEGNLDADSPGYRPPCGQAAWTNHWHKNILEEYLRVFSSSGIPVTVTEGVSRSDSHTLGLVLSAAGGALSGGGSETITTDITDRQTGVIDAWVGNRVNYRLQMVACRPGRWKPYEMYMTLSDFRYAGHIDYAACVGKARGAAFTTGSAVNNTYTAGVEFPMFSTEAQSGYGSSQQLTFNFTRAGRICGNSSRGPAQSSELSAR